MLFYEAANIRRAILKSRVFRKDLPKYSIQQCLFSLRRRLCFIFARRFKLMPPDLIIFILNRSPLFFNKPTKIFYS